MDIELVAEGLEFPEGPIAMNDGSVILTEIKAKRLTRVAPDGTKTTVAETGGGPNGAAIGPDGKIYVTNNGGSFEWHDVNGLTIPGPTPPSHTGGWGRCTGFGQAHDGPNETNSPSYDASSCVHRARIASTYSRSTVRRLPGGTPWSASSSVFQPKPAPTVTRPPERWSRVAIALASVIGSDSTGSETAVDSRIRDVTAAAVASDTHGSSVRM